MATPIAGIAGSVLKQQVKVAGEQPQQYQTGGRSFESVLQSGARRPGESPNTPGVSSAPASPSQVPGAAQAPTRPEFIDPVVRREVTRFLLNDGGQSRGGGLMDMFSRAETANDRSDAILKELGTKKDLTSGELLMMQAVVYKASQSTEVLSKVIDQVTGSVKAILNTNV